MVQPELRFLSVISSSTFFLEKGRRGKRQNLRTASHNKQVSACSGQTPFPKMSGENRVNEENRMYPKFLLFFPSLTPKTSNYDVAPQKEHILSLPTNFCKTPKKTDDYTLPCFVCLSRFRLLSVHHLFSQKLSVFLSISIRASSQLPTLFLFFGFPSFLFFSCFHCISLSLNAQWMREEWKNLRTQLFSFCLTVQKFSFRKVATFFQLQTVCEIRKKKQETEVKLRFGFG